VHIAEEVDAHHHGHIEGKPHGTGVQPIGYGCVPHAPPHAGKVHDVDNQQVDDAEYPSDEMTISAFTLHEDRVWLIKMLIRLLI
jgi:hypothetical protein